MRRAGASQASMNQEPSLDMHNAPTSGQAKGPRGAGLTRRDSAFDSILHPGNDNLAFSHEHEEAHTKKPSITAEKYNPTIDHSSHELYVEMDELDKETWVEKARWLKYEELLDETRGTWGKPHVSNLSFQSMISLRICMEDAALLLDLDANDFHEVVDRVVSRIGEMNMLTEKVKAQIRKVLGLRHKHVGKDGLMTRRQSLAFEQNNKLLKASGKEQDHKLLMEADHTHDKKPNIMACLDKKTEGTMILVGSLKCITRPLVAMVRLSKAIMMPKTTEVSLPVRFIFVAFTPSTDLELDHHEIGRSMATMMANPDFHSKAYHACSKMDLMDGMNDFLDESVLLPPGDWDRKNLLSIAEMLAMRQRMKQRRINRGLSVPENETKVEEEEPDIPARNPLQRIPNFPFGGIIGDIKQRYPFYLADIKDGLNSQTVAATIFIYFACLSGAIAFGGLMGDSTRGHIGISETIIVSAVSGLIFALFSGCPLIITGVTGPVLLYDQALWSFCESSLTTSQFLPWRFWIGLWTFVIALVVAALQGSTLVRYFTRFTKDIFNALVALLFIVSAFTKLGKIFGNHSLLTLVDYSSTLPTACQFELLSNNTSPIDCSWDNMLNSTTNKPFMAQPNTALLSMFLMLGTFFVAYFLRVMRTSHYMGKSARKAMGDFGVPIAIVIMVAIAYAAQDVYTEKLSVPDGLKVTNDKLRGWVISPFGNDLPAWAMFVAILPAILLYLLLFMETHICELIMMEKTKEAKGAGLHLDIVLLSLLNFAGGLFGGPWICAATVRAVSHVSALTVMSTTAKPGEPLQVVGVRDQRVSAGVVSILLGISVAMAPILKMVPFAVLFGVFLYMGVSGMNGVQFFDRVFLCFMPKKHHPNVSYVEKVKTWRMVLFTVLQALGLVILWVVKSIPAIALAFPFFVVMMIPYRYCFKYIFNPEELEMLDGKLAGKNLSGEKGDEDDEPDFYAAAMDCPVAPGVSAPLHRGLLGLIQATSVIGDIK